MAWKEDACQRLWDNLSFRLLLFESGAFSETLHGPGGFTVATNEMVPRSYGSAGERTFQTSRTLQPSNTTLCKKKFHRYLKLLCLCALKLSNDLFSWQAFVRKLQMSQWITGNTHHVSIRDSGLCSSIGILDGLFMQGLCVGDSSIPFISAEGVGVIGACSKGL